MTMTEKLIGSMRNADLKDAYAFDAHSNADNYAIQTVYLGVIAECLAYFVDRQSKIDKEFEKKQLQQRCENEKAWSELTKIRMGPPVNIY